MYKLFFSAFLTFTVLSVPSLAGIDLGHKEIDEKSKGPQLLAPHLGIRGVDNGYQSQGTILCPLDPNWRSPHALRDIHMAEKELLKLLGLPPKIEDVD